MRFEVTGALDAIERGLATDVLLTQAVVDVGPVAFMTALGGARDVNMLRLGMVVDALAQHLGEGAVMLYPVAARGLLADQDLTSKERMVLGRWADDGLIEVVPDAAERALEVADLSGLPLITAVDLRGHAGRYSWIQHRPDRIWQMVPQQGGARLVGPVPTGPTTPDGPGATLLARTWRCSRPECPSFGTRRLRGQPVAHLRSGVPSCPRHGEPLENVGPRPAGQALAVMINNSVRLRFAAWAERPVAVGRAPDDPVCVELGPMLEGEAARQISRNHAVFELRPDGTLMVTDISTNGTVVRRRPAPLAPAEPVELERGRPYALSPWDTVQLYTGVEVCRADRHLIRSLAPPGSVMADAPTMAMPPQGL
jgi:hypothetical protein